MRRQVSFRRPDRDGFLLDTADVALISDIVTAQTDYTLDEIYIIEVK